MVKEYARRAEKGEKNRWENFQKDAFVPHFSVTETKFQSCVITTRAGQTNKIAQRDFPSGVVVWNGNGVRARWASPCCEIKKVVQAINPDMFCFTETKINSEKLLALPGFEKWIHEENFNQIFCSWSKGKRPKE